jgi:hypothetical protein
MEVWCEGVYWIKLAQGGVMWLGLVNKAMNLKSRKFILVMLAMRF